MEIEVVAAMLIVLVGGVLSGIAGFGFALVAVPPLLFIYDPPTVTALAILLTTVTRWVILLDSWREIRWRTIGALMPGAVVGIGIGVVMLQRLDAAYFRLLAGLVVVVTSMTMIRGWTIRGADSPVATAVTGVASGVFNTTVGMAGPPVVFLFTTRNYSVKAFRGSVTTVFYLVSLTGLTTLFQRDIVGSSQLRTALLLLPAAIGGMAAGQILVRRFSAAMFRRLILLMLLVTGSAGVVSALQELV